MSRKTKKSGGKHESITGTLKRIRSPLVSKSLENLIKPSKIAKTNSRKKISSKNSKNLLYQFPTKIPIDDCNPAIIQLHESLNAIGQHFEKNKQKLKKYTDKNMLDILYSCIEPAEIKFFENMCKLYEDDIDKKGLVRVILGSTPNIPSELNKNRGGGKKSIFAMLSQFAKDFGGVDDEDSDTDEGNTDEGNTAMVLHTPPHVERTDENIGRELAIPSQEVNSPVSGLRIFLRAHWLNVMLLLVSILMFRRGYCILNDWSMDNLQMSMSDAPENISKMFQDLRNIEQNPEQLSLFQYFKMMLTSIFSKTEIQTPQYVYIKKIITEFLSNTAQDITRNCVVKTDIFADSGKESAISYLKNFANLASNAAGAFIDASRGTSGACVEREMDIAQDNARLALKIALSNLKTITESASNHFLGGMGSVAAICGNLYRLYYPRDISADERKRSEKDLKIMVEQMVAEELSKHDIKQTTLPIETSKIMIKLPSSLRSSQEAAVASERISDRTDDEEYASYIRTVISQLIQELKQRDDSIEKNKKTIKSLYEEIENKMRELQNRNSRLYNSLNTSWTIARKSYNNKLSILGIEGKEKVGGNHTHKRRT